MFNYLKLFVSNVLDSPHSDFQLSDEDAHTHTGTNNMLESAFLEFYH